MYSQGVDAATTTELINALRAGGTWWITTFFSDIFDIGVVVGVLSVGVLVRRAVVERRRPIAVLRALGCQPRGVLAALLLEALLVTSIGVGLGLLAGFLVGYALVSVLAGPFSVPLRFRVEVPQVVVPVILVYTAVLLASVPSAVRASRLPVAQALRIVD